MKIIPRNNLDEVFRDLDTVVADMKSVAAVRTLNTLQEQAAVVGFRKIAEVYGVGPRTTEKYATVELASPDHPEATITVKGPGFPLIAFNARQTRAGVTAKIKGRLHLFRGAFIARMPNGHVGVFARGSYAGKGSTTLKPTGRIGRFVLGRGRRVKRNNRWGSSELPVNELFTSSPGDTFANEDVVDAMQDRIEEQAPKVMAREIAAVRLGF